MKNLKTLWYVIIIVLFILVTFFGLGPVLFADGGMWERMLTLAVVIVLYIIIGVMFIRVKNQGR